MSNSIFVRKHLLIERRIKQCLNILIADGYAPVYHSPLEPVDGELVAYFLSKLSVAPTILNHAKLKLLHGHIIAARKFRYRPR